MSRSIRRRPYAPICGGPRSQKRDKQISNRRERRVNKVRFAQKGEDAHLIPVHQGMDEWNMAYDGTKHYAPYRPVRFYHDDLTPEPWDYQDWAKWARRK